MSTFVREKEHLQRALLFLIKSKEKASGKPLFAGRIIMVNMLHQLEHVRHGFDNLKVAISL